MGSIRPLFTITVLVVVGAYLYVKINEGPVKPRASAHDHAAHAPQDIPPLATSGGATLAQDTAAPAWPPADVKAETAPSPSHAPAAPTTATPAPNVLPATAPDPTAAANDDAAKNALPEVPPIPELPPLPQSTNAASPTQPVVAPPTELPNDVPQARYGDEAHSSTEANIPPAATAVVPASPTASTSPASNSATASPSTLTPPDGALANAASSAPPATPPADAAAAPAAPATPSAAPSATTPPREDRYGLGASTSPPGAPSVASTPPVTPLAAQPPATPATSFDASWPTIQAALERRDLKQAHQLLSKWHADESLSPTDAQKVETLLGELAGTVIYSTEHQLEPARAVKTGETLETIAQEYNVPWQLLGKINGIQAPDQVRPGHELKVVRGPFSAVVDLKRSELSLEVDGRYAGTFPVTIPAGVAEGQWVVERKLAGASAPVTPASYGASPAGDRTIVLRSAAAAGAATSGPTLVIASSAPTTGTSALQVSAQDAEDLSDILSIGSRVTVRR